MTKQTLLERCKGRLALVEVDPYRGAYVAGKDTHRRFETYRTRIGETDGIHVQLHDTHKLSFVSHWNWFGPREYPMDPRPLWEEIPRLVNFEDKIYARIFAIPTRENIQKTRRKIAKDHFINTDSMTELGHYEFPLVNDDISRFYPIKITETCPLIIHRDAINRIALLDEHELVRKYLSE